MKRNIYIEKIIRTPVEEQQIEVVERKGVGHPDSMADGIADAVSRALCKEYKSSFGIAMHHNTDQVEIVGGYSKPKFGGGKMITPIYILLSGRATTLIDNEIVPIHTIAIKAAKDYLRSTIRNLDVDNDVVIDSRISQGSTDLVDVFKRSNASPLANDTSFGVGHAPFSDAEMLCLEVEKKMDSDDFKKKFPESGEDIKVMALRENNKITLTIADAMVDRHIPDMDHYRKVIAEMTDYITDYASKLTKRDVEVNINTGDDFEKNSIYLTVTGTSAEMGDDGSVGRGNRVNGLITPYRHMSMEAAAGKNPINHSGKMYNLVSNEMAADITDSIKGIKEVYIRILSQIGKPIDQPKACSVQLILEDGVDFDSIKDQIYEISDRHLENIREITEKVIKGDLCTF